MSQPKLSYPIYIDQKLLSDEGLFKKHISGNQVMLVTNPIVAKHHLEPIKSLLTDYQYNEVILEDGEQFKNNASVEKIYAELLRHGHDRSTTLIAFGGGVVGDVTGFAAACYHRGVNYIQVPTTLLAQVDSSIGGKTGINHSLGKNMIGAFHDPCCVITDITCLETLPQKEFCSGIAEIIKYGLVYDAKFFNWLEKNIDSLVQREPEVLLEAIRRCAEMKAEIVAQDPKDDQGLRVILNFGHTFGHAIESAMGFGTWLHGEAISLGMCLATYYSVSKGWLEGDVFDKLKTLLAKAKLPTHVPADVDIERILQLMMLDKKTVRNKIRLVGLEAIGKPTVVDGVESRDLLEILKAVIAHTNTI